MTIINNKTRNKHDRKIIRYHQICIEGLCQPKKKKTFLFCRFYSRTIIITLLREQDIGRPLLCLLSGKGLLTHCPQPLHCNWTNATHTLYCSLWKLCKSYPASALHTVGSESVEEAKQWEPITMLSEAVQRWCSYWRLRRCLGLGDIHQRS